MNAAPEVFDLFPTPVTRVPGVLSPAAAVALGTRLSARAGIDNHRSGALAHTDMLRPGEDAEVDALVAAIGPHVQAFGELLFGQVLRWLVKELWVNVLDTGGHQALHNHANSFASGVLYLSPCDDSARTAFLRPMGMGEFALRNASAGMRPNRFTAGKWIAPQPEPGDLLLFPSWLLHEVPPNQGGRRVTVAFNAICDRLEAFGYTLSFGP